MRGLSLIAASGGHSSSPCAGLSPSRPLLLRSTGSRRAGSVIVAHGLSCSVACGIFPDQGSNPCPLHWQADSQPLRHQGSPGKAILFKTSLVFWYTQGFVYNTPHLLCTLKLLPGFYILPVCDQCFIIGKELTQKKTLNVILTCFSNMQQMWVASRKVFLLFLPCQQTLEFFGYTFHVPLNIGG